MSTEGRAISTPENARVASHDVKAMLDSTLASPEAISVSTLEDGWLLYANKRWLEVVEYTRRKWRGWPLIETDYWADRNARDRLVKTLREKGERSIVSEAHITYRTCSGAMRRVVAYVERMTIDRHDCMCVVLMRW
jgi:PAS domain-containing protein